MTETHLFFKLREAVADFEDAIDAYGHTDNKREQAARIRECQIKVDEEMKRLDIGAGI